jgi:hypothetical protein
MPCRNACKILAFSKAKYILYYQAYTKLINSLPEKKAAALTDMLWGLQFQPNYLLRLFVSCVRTIQNVHFCKRTPDAVHRMLSVS